MALTKISGEVLQQPFNVGVITASGINATGISTLGITSASSLYVAGVSTISVNSSTDALRITQTGTGNALVVEDAANPDATPFVVTTAGNVAIGTTSPNSNAILDIAPAASATVRVHSRTNVVPVTSLELLTGENETWGTDTSTDFRFKNNATDLSLEIGKSGVTTESVRVFSTGEVGIGTTISTPGSKLQVVGGLFVSGNITATGNVSVAGTVTYEDTTNVDSIGIVTARSGVHITSGNLGIGTNAPVTSVDASRTTGAIALPQGTTAQRPTGNAPYIRYNTTNSALEFYNGTDWVEIISDYFPSGSTILG